MSFEEAVRTILEKNPGLRAKYLIEELRQKTGLSRSTIYAQLRSLEIKNQINIDKCKYHWGGLRASNEDRAMLEHSRKLISGLEAILLEDRVGWLSEWHESRYTFKIENEGIKVKEFAEEHLISPEYESIYGLLSAHREVNNKIVRDHEEGRISDRVFDMVTKCVTKMNEDTLTSEEEAEVKKIVNLKLDSYSELVEAIRLLERKIEHGQPLKGKCQLCS